MLTQVQKIEREQRSGLDMIIINNTWGEVKPVKSVFEIGRQRQIGAQDCRLK